MECVNVYWSTIEGVYIDGEFDNEYVLGDFVYTDCINTNKEDKDYHTYCYTSLEFNLKAYFSVKHSDEMSVEELISFTGFEVI